MDHFYLKQSSFNTVTCAALSQPANGQVAYSNATVDGGYPVDTVATFSCNSRYSRSGSSSRTCQTSGNWNQETPTCNLSNTNIIFP